MLNYQKILNNYNNVNSITFESTNNSDVKQTTTPTIQKSVEDSVEIISQKLEEEKVSNKKAITVGISVLILSTLVAVLNPKNSKNLTNKLTIMRDNFAAKLERNKSKDNLSGKIHRACSTGIDWSLKALQFSNNFNSAKDVAFKWFCTEKKEFLSVRDLRKRRKLKNMDKKFRNIMTKPYNAITKWFDNIGKYTVKTKYRSVSKKMDNIENLLIRYRDRIPESERSIFDSKINEIKRAREYFNESNVLQRLDEQEKLMNNLEKDFLNRYEQYKHGFGNKWVDKGTHVSNNMTFWAEEILMPTRDRLELQGKEAVTKLVGNQKDKKGLYDELIDLVGTHLDKQEKESLIKTLEKTDKKLRNANHSECVDYFDKKRDLILGSAPTDIVTAIGGLGLSGILITTADSKDEKITNALTGAFPVIAGLGASMAFTAMLFSGVKGMLYGALTSVGLSKLGSIIDKQYFKPDKKNVSKEVINA